jgi:hypothetical protein
MRLKESETKVVSQTWGAIGLSFVIWLAVTGFLLYRLRSLLQPIVVVPPPTTTPTIDQEKITSLQEVLNERANTPRPEATASSGTYRSEPFD